MLVGSLASSIAAGLPASVLAASKKLVLINGKIWTNNASAPYANALAISNGLILAVGSDSDMRSRLPGADVIDLRGRMTIPGLIDSHTHIVREGRFYILELRWDGVTSLERGLQMISEQARRTPKGQWVRVIGGWSPYQFSERRLPTPEELTQAAPDTPVFVSYLYSRGFLNRAGVDALALTQEIAAKAPGGARYELRSSGAIIYAEPDPTLLYATIAALPTVSTADQIGSTRAFYRELNRFGLTGAIDVGGGGHKYPTDYIGSETLARDGELPLRISFDLFPQRPGKELEDFSSWTRDFALNKNLASELENGFEIDGAGEFLTHSAGDFENFLAPRPDLESRPGWRKELLDVTQRLLQARWPIRMHATYNESITKIMEVFEAAHKAEVAAGRAGFSGLRWAIDHAETISVQNIARVKTLGGGIAIQDRMAFAGEYFAERYGRKAAASAPPLRDLIKSGVRLGAGTDATRVSSYNPWMAIQWLVTGATVGGDRLMAERHRLSRVEALQMWTSGSAWFAGEAEMKGIIAAGRYADLAVLSDDIFSVSDDRIGGIESVLTITGGRVVHGNGEFTKLAPPMPDIMPLWSPIASFGGYQKRSE